MDNAVFFIAGAAITGVPLLIWYLGNLAFIKSQKILLGDKAKRLKSDEESLAQLSNDLGNKKNQLMDDYEKKKRHIAEEIATKNDELEQRIKLVNEEIANKIEQQDKELENRKQQIQKFIDEQNSDIEFTKQKVSDSISAFEKRRITYDEIVRENNLLKHDLFNLSVKLKKTERDHSAIIQHQEEIKHTANQLAERYLDDNVSWIGDKISANNFASCKQRLLKVIGDCRDIGFEVPQDKEATLVEKLKKEFEQAVRDEFQRQEQARIKAQIREEEKLARELEKQKQDAEREKTDKEREKTTIQEALDKALRATKDEHSAEVEYWKSKLIETEEKLKEAEEKERAISQAQLTKSGYVYVLSNIGSFGEGVFKVGMTRRLEPMDRVRELGDASVPFPFDVHMMISCDNAPALENALHKEIHELRMNKVNFRKEFFRVDLESIRKIVESNHGEVDYVAEPAALQYHESMNMSKEDYEFIEQTAESVMGQDDPPFADD